LDNDELSERRSDPMEIDDYNGNEEHKNGKRLNGAKNTPSQLSPLVNKMTLSY
jgi:hypothetical protein